MAARLKVNSTAPDFELKDTTKQLIHLSDYRGRNPVVLVFTRGFI
jgi:peroxiredoxin